MYNFFRFYRRTGDREPKKDAAGRLIHLELITRHLVTIPVRNRFTGNNSVDLTVFDIGT